MNARPSQPPRCTQVLLLTALLALLGRPAEASLFPQLSARYPVGDPDVENPRGRTEGPKNLAAGDFNDDGLADIVTANLDGSVSVLLGRRDDGLEEQILVCPEGLLEGASLRDVAVSDFDEDGRLDAVVADVTGSVVLLLGDGTGLLVPVQKIATGPARTVAVGDVNGDGREDVLVGTSPPDCDQSLCPDQPSTDHSLAVLLASGEGRLSAPRHIVHESRGCFYHVDLADLNGDGSLDALALDFDPLCGVDTVSSPNGTVLVFEGAGDGTFSLARTIETEGRGPRSFHVGYLDERWIEGAPEDGATLDLVIPNRDSHTLEIYLGEGGGVFGPPRILPAGDTPRAVTAGDLNGDGLVELVATNRNTNTISVFRGLGDGRFSDPMPLAAGTSPREVVLADVNGDGALDGAVSNRISGDVSFFRGRRGLAGFLVPESYYPAGITPVGIVAEDFNEDGSVDLATVNLRSHDVRVRLNRGTGEMGPESVYPAGFEPSGLAAGDVDGDSHVDLVVACVGDRGSPLSVRQGSIITLLGHADGTFSAPIPTVGSDGRFHPYWLRLGDLSGDGILDAAVGGVDGKLAILRGAGDGTFVSAAALESGRAGSPVTFTLADFNGDGQQDIATSGGRTILNDGYLFDPEVERKALEFPVPRGDWVVESSDLDQDGALDLVVALTFVEPDPISVHYGRGDGTFEEPIIYETGMGVVAIEVADMDRDGILDIVSGNRCTADVTILRGVGDRTFERLQTVRTYSVEGLAVTDLNGDGRLDLAGAGLALWVVLQNGDTALIDPDAGNPSGIQPIEGIYLNELMALNRTFYADPNGVTPDWVELYNHSAETLDLGDWILRQHDSNGGLRDWRFPQGTSIAALGHLVVFCERNGVLDNGDLYCTAFELSADGETVSLLDPSGEERDRVAFPPLPEDTVYARFVDGARYLSHNPVPTLGSPNAPPANLDPSVRPGDPSLGPDGRLRISARTFDDIGLAYAAVHFRRAGETEFSEMRLHDDGLHGDEGPGDGTFGAILPELEPGVPIEYYLRVVDLEGEVATEPGDPADTAGLLRIRMPPEGRPLRISEVVAANQRGIQDEAGQFEDWVEITNCGTEPVSLDGVGITKDCLERDTVSRFPPGALLLPGEFLVVFCDKDPEEGPFHADFNLAREGDSVYLIEAEEPWGLLDAITFGPLDFDTAFGVLDCGLETSVLGEPTPGMPNSGASALFVRGDMNGDGVWDLSDPVSLLGHLFLGGPAPRCRDAADADDNGRLNLTDSIHLLGFLFLGGPAPPDPFPGCGADLTEDPLGCRGHAGCN